MNTRRPRFERRSERKRRRTFAGAREWLMLFVAIHVPLLMILATVDFLQPLKTALLLPQ